MPIKGLFFKEGEQEIEPSIPVPGMVPDPAAKSLLKFAVSAYSIESILKVNQGHSGWTTQRDLPSDSEIQLDTRSMDYYFPGIEAKYGFNFTSVRYEVIEIANLTMIEDDQSVSFDGNVRL